MLHNGDFNLNLVDHNSDSKVSEFINLLYSHSYIPCIDKPTRIKPNNTGGISATLIDNIFTNDIFSNIKSGIIITDLSYHFPIFTTQQHSKVNSSTSTPIRTKSRLFKPDNIRGLINALTVTDWQHVFSTEDPEKAYNTFNKKISSIYTVHLKPIKYLNVKRLKIKNHGLRKD